MATKSTRPRNMDAKRRNNRHADRKLREWIFELAWDSNIDPDLQLAALDRVYEWIKTRQLPGPVKLRVVSNA